jgi:hypothetical protein
MAITELQKPQQFTPAYNDMHHLVNSSNKAQANFKYLFKIYVNGTYVGKSFKVPPDPTYGFGLFDVKRVIQTYITHDISLSIVGVVANTLNNDYYTIGYGEEYGDLSSGVTQYNDLTTSSSIYAYAGSVKELDFISYIDDTYIMDSSGSLFMTNQPRPFRIFEDQNAWLGMMDDTASHAKTLVVRTYNINDGIIQTVHIRNNLTALFMTGLAGYNLNSISGAELLLGAQPIITAATHYYTVQAGTDTPNPYGITELMRYNIDRTCEWDAGGLDIYFLNALGWFDSFRFTRLNTKSHDITSKYYKQSTGQFGASSFTVAKTDRAKTQYYTDFNDKWKLRSAYITEAESTWLLELVTSPQVYINLSEVLVPITITQSNYDERKRSEGQVFSLEIDIEFSIKNYRQRY